MADWPSRTHLTKTLIWHRCMMNPVLKPWLRRRTQSHTRALIILNIGNLISGLANGTLSARRGTIRSEPAAFNPSLINACCWKTGLGAAEARAKASTITIPLEKYGYRD